jgi:WD40 repeat protein
MFLSSACTCMVIYNDNYLICGYSNGLISIINLLNGKKIIDINGHGRWINSIDVKDDKIISISQDNYLRIWQLNEINGRFKVNLFQVEHFEDLHLLAVKFRRKSNTFCLTCFETNEIFIYKLKE